MISSPAKITLRLGLLRSNQNAIGAFVMSVLRAIVFALLPIPLKVGFDFLAPSPSTQNFDLRLSLLLNGISRQESAFFALGLALLILAIAAAVLTRSSETSASAAAHQLAEGLRERLIERLLRVKQSFFSKHQPFDIASRLSQDSLTVEGAIRSGILALTFAVPMAVIAIAIMLLTDSSLALFMIFALPLFYVLTAQSAREWTVHTLRAQRESDFFDRDVTRTLASLAHIKNFNMEDSVLAKLMARLRVSQAHVATSERAQAWSHARHELLKNALRAGILVLGGLLYARQQTSIGAIVLFLAYVETVPTAISMIAEFRGRLRASSRAIERITELEGELSTEAETEGARSAPSLPFPDANNLVFENVHLPPLAPSADSESPQIVLNAEFEQGQLVALLGRDKADLSLIARLLNRLDEPTSGTVFIGSTPLQRYKLDVLRRLVTVVDRDPFFFHGTIRENLLLSNVRSRELDDQRINEAVSAAKCDFISELPELENTVIGEGGFALEANQAARLGLARAFLCEGSRIFFFDRMSEVLSAEQTDAMLDGLSQLVEQGALVIWATTKPEEASRADLIFDLNRQQLSLELDRPSELLRQIVTSRLPDFEA